MIDAENTIQNDVDIDSVIKIANGFGDTKRFSSFLIKQLVFCLYNNNDLFKILNEIRSLEYPDYPSRTRQPSEFEGPVLRGLWHKHYTSGGVKGIAINLKKSINKTKNKKDPLRTLIGHLLDVHISGKPKQFRLEQGHFKGMKQEEVMDSIKNIMETGYKGLIKNGELTGKSYIVYAKNEDNNGDIRNYYLCLASHYDDDAEIRNIIDSFCIPQFPFLEEKNIGI